MGNIVARPDVPAKEDRFRALSLLVVFGVAVLATVAVRVLELPLDAGFLGLSG